MDGRRGVGRKERKERSDSQGVRGERVVYGTEERG
jgi:hypothetical protein